MRRNIDLTNNMMFSSTRLLRGINLRQLEKTLGHKLRLWNPNDWLDGEQKDSIIDRKLQVIPLGDYNERQFIRECIEMDSGSFCDCCGDSLLKHPWSRHYGLCRSCAAHLESSYGAKKSDIFIHDIMSADRNRVFI